MEAPQRENINGYIYCYRTPMSVVTGNEEVTYCVLKIGSAAVGLHTGAAANLLERFKTFRKGWKKMEEEISVLMPQLPTAALVAHQTEDIPRRCAELMLEEEMDLLFILPFKGPAHELRRVENEGKHLDPQKALLTW